MPDSRSKRITKGLTLFPNSSKESVLFFSAVGVATLGVALISARNALREASSIFSHKFSPQSLREYPIFVASSALGKATLYASAGCGAFGYLGWKYLGSPKSGEELNLAIRKDLVPNSLRHLAPDREGETIIEIKTKDEFRQWLLDEDQKSKELKMARAKCVPLLEASFAKEKLISEGKSS